MQKTVIIVAGGSGKRMKTNEPKQFLSLKNKAVLMHSIEAFYKYDNNINIIITLPEIYIDHWKSLCHKFNFKIGHKIVKAGKTRFHSVKNGIKAIKKSDLIAVHDGVRPLIDKFTIDKCFKIAAEKGNAIPVTDIPESIREVMHKSSRSVNRKNYKIVQTPQVFKSEILIKAYKQEFKEHFTDDAGLLDEMGEKLNLVDGNRENIKITTQSDLVFAEALMDYYTLNG